MLVAGIVGSLASACVVTDEPAFEVPSPPGPVVGAKPPIEGGNDERRVVPSSADAGAHKADAEPEAAADGAGTTDGGSDASVSCSGWVTPDPRKNCSKSGGNGKCDTTCTSGGTTWKSECESGMCACRMNDRTMCTCITTAANGCGTCCPGMP